jgi:hypothetical protein
MKPSTFDRAPLVGAPALPSAMPAYAGDRDLEQLLAGSRVMRDSRGIDRTARSDE